MLDAAFYGFSPVGCSQTDRSSSFPMVRIHLLSPFVETSRPSGETRVHNSSAGRATAGCHLEPYFVEFWSFRRNSGCAISSSPLEKGRVKHWQPNLSLADFRSLVRCLYGLPFVPVLTECSLWTFPEATVLFKQRWSVLEIEFERTISVHLRSSCHPGATRPALHPPREVKDPPGSLVKFLDDRTRIFRADRRPDRLPMINFLP